MKYHDKFGWYIEEIPDDKIQASSTEDMEKDQKRLNQKKFRDDWDFSDITGYDNSTNPTKLGITRELLEVGDKVFVDDKGITLIKPGDLMPDYVGDINDSPLAPSKRIVLGSGDDLLDATNLDKVSEISNTDYNLFADGYGNLEYEDNPNLAKSIKGLGKKGSQASTKLLSEVDFEDVSKFEERFKELTKTSVYRRYKMRQADVILASLNRMPANMLSRKNVEKLEKIRRKKRILVMRELQDSISNRYFDLDSRLKHEPIEMLVSGSIAEIHNRNHLMSAVVDPGYLAGEFTLDHTSSGYSVSSDVLLWNIVRSINDYTNMGLESMALKNTTPGQHTGHEDDPSTQLLPLGHKRAVSKEYHRSRAMFIHQSALDNPPGFHDIKYFSSLSQTDLS